VRRGGGAGPHGARPGRGAAAAQEPSAGGGLGDRQRPGGRSPGGPGRLESPTAGRRGPGAARDRRPPGPVAPGGRAAAPRARGDDGAGGDPEPGAGRDEPRPARGVSPRAAAGHPGGAGRDGSAGRGGRGVPRQDPGGRDVRGSAGGGHAPGAASRAHAPGRPRGPRPAHLPGLDGGAPVVEAVPGLPGPRQRQGHPGRGPRPPEQREGPDPGVPGRAQAARRLPRPDPLLRRSARGGQDLPGALHRPGHGAGVRADLPGWRARRGRDPRSPAHLRGGAAGSHRPGPEAGGSTRSRTSTSATTT
jgi:hypothetical protein